MNKVILKLDATGYVLGYATHGTKRVAEPYARVTEREHAWQFTAKQAESFVKKHRLTVTMVQAPSEFVPTSFVKWQGYIR